MNLFKKKAIKKAVSVMTLVMTMTVMSGFASFTVFADTIADGALIKSNATNPDGSPTFASLDVYIVKLIGTKQFKRLVLNPEVFNSYDHLNWGDIQTVSQSVMDSYTTSGLVRVDGDPDEKVYALVPDGDVGSKGWINVTATEFLGVSGSEDGDSIYTINSTDAGYYTAVGDVTTVTELETYYSAGTLPDASEAGTGLTVALSSSTAASVSTIVDSTNGDGAQAFVPTTKVNFTASSDGDVVVNTLKFKRSGVPSADTDFAEFYLYDGDTLLADYSSISSGVLTFTNTSGLFTVGAGTTKAIDLKVNLDDDTATGRNYNFSILATSDVVTDGAAVFGSFPVTGNTMSVVTVTDLAKYTVADSSYSTTIDPGLTDQTVWKFSNTVSDQNVQIENMKITFVGTLDPSDLANFKLEVAGTQIGSTVEAMASDKSVTFDLSGTPYAIDKGVIKYIELKADIVGGSDRTFQAYFYNKEDIKVKDLEYGVYITPNQEDTYTKIYAGAATTVNAGSLTVTKATDSTSGNVALGALTAEIAKFDFKATGEDIKVDNVYVYVDMSTSTGLYQLKLFVDGSQVGTAIDLGETTATAIPTGNSFIIPAGETKTLVVKTDLKEADGTALTDTETITFQLGNVKSTDYTKQSSGGTSTTGTSSSNVLTVRSGTLVPSENTSLHDYSSSNPVGVVNATNVKVASLILTAGAGEGVTVTQLIVGDDPGSATYDFGTYFQNLRLEHDGAALSTTQGSLSSTEGVDYSFSLSPAVSIDAGTQYVVDVYADILGSASGAYATPEAGLELVSATATGNDTGTDASYTTPAIDLQNLYVADTGSLTVTIDGDTPATGQLVMGETDVELAKFQFTAGTSEDVDVTRIEISDSTTHYNSSLSNVKLYDGTTQVGSTIASFDSTNDADFILSTAFTIPAGTSKILTVKASANAYPNATSGGTVTLAILANTDIDTTGADSGTAITGSSEVVSATGTAQDIYRTRITAVKGSSSPAGTATSGTGSTILHVTTTADASYDAVLNALAFTVNGTADFTGSGDATLYKSTDLSTALSTEAYVTGTTVTGSATTSVAAAGVWDGIPVGANIRVYDDSASAYMAGTFEVSAVVSGTTLTFSTAPAALAVGDIVYYRPMQPGDGKVYFGAQTTLGADVATSATSLTVVSTDGFATGDTVVITGYVDASTGEVTNTAGGLISAIPDATTLTVGAVTLAGTIDYDFLTTTAGVTAGLISDGIVYTGNIGETIAAGTNKTFVVKGDTTGGASTKTLQLNLDSASDINWDDNVNYGIITDTDTMPITGGSLEY